VDTDCKALKPCFRWNPQIIRLKMTREQSPMLWNHQSYMQDRGTSVQSVRKALLHVEWLQPAPNHIFDPQYAHLLLIHQWIWAVLHSIPTAYLSTVFSARGFVVHRVIASKNQKVWWKSVWKSITYGTFFFDHFTRLSMRLMHCSCTWTPKVSHR